MYQNAYALEQHSRQYVQDRLNEARLADKVRLAKLIRQGLNRASRSIPGLVAPKPSVGSAI